MATYRVTRRGRRPSPIDWPKAAALGVEALAWFLFTLSFLFLMALDWTQVGVSP